MSLRPYFNREISSHDQSISSNLLINKVRRKNTSSGSVDAHRRSSSEDFPSFKPSARVSRIRQPVSSVRSSSNRSITISKRQPPKSIRDYQKPVQEKVSVKPVPAVMTSMRSGSQSMQFIVSLIEHTTHEVGLAAYNINTGEVYLSQIRERMTYVQTISTLSRFIPRQIVYCQSHQDSPLIKKLEKSFRSCNFKPLRRNLFDDTQGYRIYSERGNRNKADLNPDAKMMKMVACSALSALIYVVESDLKLNVKYNLMHIEWHYPQNVLIIDEQTVSDLELFINSETNKTNNSFLENFKCLTYGGTRMLRSNLLQPLIDQKAIEDRLDSVFFLLDNPSFLQLLKNELVKFKMLQSILVKFIQNPKNFQSKVIKSYTHYILLMSHFISSATGLKARIQAWLQGTNLTNFGSTITNILKLAGDTRLEDIRMAICDNIDTQILATFEGGNKQKKQSYLFIVKEEKITDDDCQLSRLIYSHIIEEMASLCQEYKSKSLMNLKLMSAEKRGYFLSCASTNPSADLKKLAELIKQDIVHISVKDRKTVTFQTSRLISLNNKLRINENRILMQSEPIIMSVIHTIQERLQILFQLNFSLSTLDMLMAFANFVRFYSSIRFCRPVFQPNIDIMDISELSTIWTHERFFKMSHRQNFISSQLRPITILSKEGEDSQEHYNLMISTAYVVILSQIGCPIPAESYTGCIFNMLLSKLCNKQSVENSLSHFQYEAITLNGLLETKGTNQKTLLLIDEIIKGTNYEQELSLSLSFLSQLSEMRGFTICLISDDQLLQHIRNMFGCSINVIETKSKENLLEVCIKLGMPQQFIDALEKSRNSERKIEKQGLCAKYEENVNLIDLLEEDLVSLVKILHSGRLPTEELSSRFTSLRRFLQGSPQFPDSSSSGPSRKSSKAYDFGSLT